MDHIVESALLVHETATLSNEEIREIWGDTPSRITWMEQGKIVIDGIDRFLEFRSRMLEGTVRPGTVSPREAALIAKLTGKYKRITCHNLDMYAETGADAVVTSSGAMSVCAREGIGAAVTADMIGFLPEMLYGRSELLVTRGEGPPDIEALTSLPVALISGGPWDMLDCEGTFRFLEQHGVRSLGVNRDSYTGCLFVGNTACLSGRLEQTVEQGRSVLIVNEIPEDKRICDRSILNEADKYALEAERQGGYYRPSYLTKLDQLTGGLSSKIRLQALVDNARFAAGLE